LKFTLKRIKRFGFVLHYWCVQTKPQKLHTKLKDFIMPPSPKAILFVLTELWSPQQVETLVYTFRPPGFSLADLRALLSAPAVSYAPYHDHLVDVAIQLVLAGHQRNPQQVLQELVSSL
jgi:hypothetical protein